MFEAVTSAEFFNRYKENEFREIAHIPGRTYVFVKSEGTGQITVLVLTGSDDFFIGSFDLLAYADILDDIEDGLDIELILRKNGPIKIKTIPSKEASMNEINSHFIIDMSTIKVTCRTCRQRCQSLTLIENEAFVCSNQLCHNSMELLRAPDGRYHVATLEEMLGIGKAGIKKLFKSR